MARFDRQIETAKRLIAKNGQVCTWRQIQNVPNPAKPWETTQVVTDTDVPICFLPLDRIGKEFLRTLGGDVPAGDEYGLMGQVSFTPALSDTVIRDGVAYQIDTIDLLSPNGQKILYTVVFKT